MTETSSQKPNGGTPRPPAKPPSTWGVSSAAFYAYHRLKPVRVVALDGTAITGLLIGVDTYDLILERGDKTAILIPKHAVKVITGEEKPK